MDKLTQQIKTLNEVYTSMKTNFDILKKMFKTSDVIMSEITLSEATVIGVYKRIIDQLETDEVNNKFTAIVKGIKNEKYKRNR